MIRTCALAVASLCVFSGVAHAGEQTVNITSGGGYIGEMVCPGAPPTPVKPPPTGTRPQPWNDQIPTRAELGALAEFTPRDPAVLSPSAIPDFALRDSSGAARPRRVAVWGDSHVAAGPFMAQLIKAIRDHGETVGTRFLPPTMGRANVRLPTLHAYCIGPGWSTALAFSANDVLQTGPGLANRIGTAGAGTYLWVDFRSAEREATLKQTTLVYRGTGDIELLMSVNDGPEQTVTLGGSGTSFLTVTSDQLISTLKFTVTRGTLNLEGFQLDYAQAPLVRFDVFGLPGSTARGWANADPAAVRDALHGDTYDAVVLEYGTNEGSDLHLDSAKYAASLTRTLSNMRQVFPNASCVLVGPPDRGVLVNRKGAASADYLQYAHIHQMIARVQAQLAPQYNCVTWNWQEYMGGPGGSYGWVYNSPSYMGRDLTHMTVAGYTRVGQALATSLGWMSDLFPK
ncbi:MAG: hypothetical protein JO346_05390 [Alphaproteobacteria bacterium]|nr:hypothetical protein [Alphaproteobacteria bacterium]